MRIVLTLDGAPIFDSGEKELAGGTYKLLAMAFCGMTDDEQAQFFEAVGQVLKTWPGPARDRQAYAVGKHMRSCVCIGDAGREFLLSIAETIRKEASNG